METVTIDWMGFTDTMREKPGFSYPPYTKYGVDLLAEKPRFGYRKAARCEAGLIVYFDGAAKGMGAHYVYSGRTINDLAAEGISAMSILTWHFDKGHRCTRLDLAVDIKDRPGFLQKCIDAAFRNNWSGTARSANVIQNTKDGGATIYIGSRSSNRFVRIYNKSAQMGEEGDWTRVEVELKGDVARGVARALVSPDFGGLQEIAPSIIAEQVNFKFREWRDIFDGGVMGIGKAQTVARQTEKWLLQTVVKAIVKFERDFPQKQIWSKIVELVTNQLDGPRQ